MKAAAIRAARTFAQTFLGVYLAGLIGQTTTVLADFANVRLIDQAAAAGMVAVLSFAMNWLENTNRIPVAGGDKG